jgi:hypothetical protein
LTHTRRALSPQPGDGAGATATARAIHTPDYAAIKAKQKRSSGRWGAGTWWNRSSPKSTVRTGQLESFIRLDQIEAERVEGNGIWDAVIEAAMSRSARSCPLRFPRCWA